ncbi:MAG TPA: hypothetical protein VL221_10385 [Bacteroidota bacterium]|nr:hypothetical protein [Bacteroidota bacterium]
MKIVKSFPAQVGGVLLLAGAILGWPLAAYATADVRAAVVAGAAVASANVLLGYVAIRYSFGRSYSTFLKAVLGGMGIRLLFMLGAFTLLLVAFRMHAVALTCSLLGFYAVFMIMEIVFLQRQMAARNGI